MIPNRIDDYTTSWARSLHRRVVSEEQRHHSRVVDIWLALPAVVGLGLLIWYITMPFPYEHWYIGLAGIVLLLPWLTRRLR